MGVAEQLGFEFGADVSSAQKALEGLAKTGEKAAKDLGKSFDGVAGQITKGFDLLKASAASFAAGFTIKKIIDAGLEAEKALQGLESAFISTGVDAPKQAAEGFAAFATSLANATGIADDEIVSLSSRLQQIGQFSEQGLKVSTQLALDFAAAYKTDLGTAFDAVGKAASGNVTALKKLGIEIQVGKTDAETFANTLRALEGIQGSAARQGQTFGAALSGLKNNFGEVLEAIGLAVIRTPILAQGLSSLKDFAFQLAEAISRNSSVISTWITSGIELAINVLKNLPGILTAAAISLALFNKGLIANFALNFLASLQGMIVGLRGVSAGFNLATISAKVFQATATLGVSLLIGYLVQAAVELGSLGAAFDLLWQRIKQGFFLIYGPIISGFANIAETLSEVTGVGKGVATKIRGFADNMAEGFGNATERVKELKASAASIKAPDVSGKVSSDVSATVGSVSTGNLFSDIKRAADVVKPSLDKLKQSLESIKSSLANVGLDQGQIVKKSFDETNKKLKEGLAAGEITRQEYYDLSKKNELKYQSEILKIREGEQKNQADLIGFGLSSLQQGAAGVPGIFSKGATELINKFAPAFTQFAGIAGQFVGFLAQGPEAVAAQVKGFIDNIPVIIENIVLALPALFEALAENFPFLIQRLAELAPSLAVQVAVSFANQMPFVATQLAVNLVAQSPNIAKGFVDSLIKEAGRLITAIADGVKQAISSVVGLGGGKGGLLGGALGGIGGGILGGGIGSIGKKFKFAEGGVVPGGAPYTDRVNALLTPGEVVLSRDQVAAAEAEKINVVSAINNLAASITGGGGQNMTVNLVIGEQQLANVILNLNRQGFRLA